MLIGDFQHNIDPKGRLFIPSHFREDLGEHFILTRGLNNCLFGYSQKEWQILDAKIRSQPMSKSRDVQLFFFSNAADVETDKQGRILLPQKLRDYASLGRDVTIIGASTRIEIWDRQRWEEFYGNISAEKVMDSMDKLGF